MLDIKITKKTSVLDKLLLREPVDLEILNLLLNSTILQKEKKIDGEFYEDERKLLEKYKNKITRDTIDGFYTADIRYARKIHYGRVYPEKGVGLVMMRYVIRHTLAKAVGLVDVDMKNAHPEIVVQYCKKNGYEISALEDYVKNRCDYLKRIMEISNLTRNQAKTLPIRLMYLGTLQSWAMDEGVNLVDIPEWLHKWSDEVTEQLTKIANIVIDNNPKLVKEVEKGTHDASWNKASAVLSTFLQEYENRALETIYTYCVNNGYIKNGFAVLCYDGIMIMDNDKNEELLIEFNKVIKKELGLDIKFDTKEFDYALSKEELEKVQITDEILDKDKLPKFDCEYFISLPCYRVKKMYFEKFVCKVMRPDPVYVYIENDGDDKEELLCFYTKAKIDETFGHLKSGELDTNLQPEKFMTRWLNDETIKCYNRMDFIPYNDKDKDEIDSSVFNLFRGFNPKTKCKFDKSKAEKILKPFHDLGRELCGGDEDHYQFLNWYIADTFQNPHRKNPIAFIIKGKQGTGKNMYLKGIGKALGGHHYISSSNPKDFFGDYAEGFYHKLLVNMNECEGRDTFDFEGRIKSFITEDTITLNKKFHCPITIKNLARLIIFTNKQNPIPIDIKSKDRRYVVFNTTDHYLQKKYGKDFWSKFNKYIQSDEFIACLYDYYNNFDCSGFSANKRPITKAYIEMCKLYVPTEVLFLANMIENTKEADMLEWNIYESEVKNKPMTPLPEMKEKKWREEGITGEKLYEEYVEFCKKFGFVKEGSSYQKHIKSFYSKLSELDLPILLYKPQNVTKYKFNADDVLKLMKQRKWIDINESDILDEVVDDEGESFDDYFEV